MHPTAAVTGLQAGLLNRYLVIAFIIGFSSGVCMVLLVGQFGAARHDTRNQMCGVKALPKQLVLASENVAPSSAQVEEAVEIANYVVKMPWELKPDLKTQVQSTCPALLLQPEVVKPLEIAKSPTVAMSTYMSLYQRYRATRATLGQLVCQQGLLGPCGGWCDVLNPETGWKLCDLVAPIVSGDSVIEFGAGNGVLGQCLLDRNAVTWWRGVDGAEHCEETSSGRVGWADATEYDPLLPVAEWAVALDLMQHIPIQLEHVALNNLHLHNTKGILLSWAVPGDATCTLNCQINQYVQQRVAQFGCYKYDEQTTAAGRAIARHDSFMVFRRVPQTPCFLLQPVPNLQP